MFKLKFNYHLATLVALLNLGILRKLRYTKIPHTHVNLRIIKILYKMGILRTFIIKGDVLWVYFKYNKGQSIVRKFSLISTPGKRCYWSLRELCLYTSKHNFAGFFILSTPKGLVTSNYALLTGHTSGEVLMKIEL